MLSSQKLISHTTDKEKLIGFTANSRIFGQSTNDIGSIILLYDLAAYELLGRLMGRKPIVAYFTTAAVTQPMVLVTG